MPKETKNYCWSDDTFLKLRPAHHGEEINIVIWRDGRAKDMCDIYGKYSREDWYIGIPCKDLNYFIEHLNVLSIGYIRKDENRLMIHQKDLPKLEKALLIQMSI